MASLAYGSTGSEVTELQKLLNTNGYDLEVDGNYGEKTQAAVSDYQQKNGLSVDGVAGDQTLSSLSKAQTSQSEDASLNDAIDAILNGFKQNATASGSVSVSDVESAISAAQNNEQLAALLKDLSAPEYTPMTSEEIKAQAEREYQSYYDQLRLSAQQAKDAQDLALENQKAGLQQTYDKQREASKEEYEQIYSQSDRQSISRGMQRSSYNAQTLANIDLEAAKAQQEIYNAQASAENQISSQQTLLAAQLADQLSQYDASQAADVLARIDELEAREYDRSTSAKNTKNNLTLQVYALLNDQLQQQVQYKQWLAEFNENVRQFNAQLAENARQFDAQMAAQAQAAAAAAEAAAAARRGSGSGSKKSTSSSGNSLFSALSSLSGQTTVPLGSLIGSMIGAGAATSAYAFRHNASKSSSGSISGSKIGQAISSAIKKK